MVALHGQIEYMGRKLEMERRRLAYLNDEEHFRVYSEKDRINFTTRDDETSVHKILQDIVRTKERISRSVTVLDAISSKNSKLRDHIDSLRFERRLLDKAYHELIAQVQHKSLAIGEAVIEELETKNDIAQINVESKACELHRQQVRDELMGDVSKVHFCVDSNLSEAENVLKVCAQVIIMLHVNRFLLQQSFEKSVAF